MIHMEYYLVVSTIMMFAGIYGFFPRRNTLAILISVELMLNARTSTLPCSTVFSFRREWKAISLHSFPSPSRLRKLQ